VEILGTDPAVTEAGQIWYNSAEKTFKATGYTAGGAVEIIVLGGKEELDAYIALLASSAGSAEIGTVAVTGANGEFSVPADTVEATLAKIVQGIDANAQALEDLGDGSVTDLQNELDATQTGAGLESDGSLATLTGDYINTASNLASAAEMLDVQVKTNTDGLAAEAATRASEDLLKVNKSGDSMTGDLSLGDNRITNLGAPQDDTDAANKVYVDSAISGISWKQPVKAATDANITLSGLQTIDGVVLAAGDRVLVKDQTNLVENGIYDVVDGAAWTRSSDFDDSPDTEVEEGAAVFVESGTLFADNGFTLLGNNTDGTSGIQVGSDDLVFIQFSGAGQVLAGAGLSKTGNEFYINMGAGIVELPSDEVGIDVLPTGSLFNTVDGTTSSTDTAAQLAVKLDGTTLTSTAAGLKVSDSVLNGVDDDIQLLQNELDATQTGAGLGADGTYTATSSANYVGSANSLDAGIQLLDTQVKTNTDALAQEVTDRTDADTSLQTELDDTQTGAGLGTDGTYTANVSANYISSATSLFNADVLLDTQVKTNTDALAQEVTDRTTSVSALKTAINAGNFNYESTTPATSHTVTHDLGDAFVTVALWIKQDDGSFKNDIGQVTLNSNNQLTVDLTAAKDIRVVVTASKDIV
jgi:hypothetical protein